MPITRVIRIAGVLVIAAVPWRAVSAQTLVGPRFGLTAGLNVPLSRLGQETGTGYLFNGILTSTPSRWPVSLRGELTYTELPGSPGRSAQHVAGFTANAVFPLPEAADAPYVLGGLGLYNSGANDGRGSENDLGVDLGAGYRWRRARATYFVEGRVMIVDYSTGERQMMPLTFGVLF